MKATLTGKADSLLGISCAGQALGSWNPGQWQDYWDLVKQNLNYVQDAASKPLIFRSGVNGLFDTQIKPGFLSLSFEDGTTAKVALPSFLVTRHGKFIKADGVEFAGDVYLGTDGNSYLDLAGKQLAASPAMLAAKDPRALEKILARVRSEKGFKAGMKFGSIAMEPLERQIDMLKTSPEVTHVVDVDGESYLHALAFWGKDEMGKRLLAAGAKPNTKNKKGEVPLVLATFMHHEGFVRLLLNAGADVNAGDNWKPLHRAASHSNAAIVALLLEKGADANALDPIGRTPLHDAAKDGCVESVKALLAAGAKPNTKDNFGKTPIDEARAKPDVLKALKAATPSGGEAQGPQGFDSQKEATALQKAWKDKCLKLTRSDFDARFFGRGTIWEFGDFSNAKVFMLDKNGKATLSGTGELTVTVYIDKKGDYVLTLMAVGNTHSASFKKPIDPNATSFTDSTQQQYELLPGGCSKTLAK